MTFEDIVEKDESMRITEESPNNLARRSEQV
jgi:hypothetical protein